MVGVDLARPPLSKPRNFSKYPPSMLSSWIACPEERRGRTKEIDVSNSSNQDKAKVSQKLHWISTSNSKTLIAQNLHI